MDLEVKQKISKKLRRERISPRLKEDSLERRKEVRERVCMGFTRAKSTSPLLLYKAYGMGEDK